MNMYQLNVLEGEYVVNNHEFYSENIDYLLPIELERKFTLVHPERFFEMRSHERTVAIEQLYLSTPGEPFNLRLREYSSGIGDSIYEATLKDTGEVTEAGLKRFEVTTPISSELYNFYKSPSVPVIRKLRSEPLPGITIDFYDDDSVQIESENEEQWRVFTETYGGDYIEVTGTPQGDNEIRAHEQYAKPQGSEIIQKAVSTLDSGTVLKHILESRSATEHPLAVHIGGRSGSGKSTIVRELMSGLDAFGLSHSLLSTDDYHRGASWLQDYNDGEPWRHWDDAIVYDTELMAQDIASLQTGTPIIKRDIDWNTAEPQLGPLMYPTDILLIEGIYATSTDITGPDDLVYEMPTPLATCIGRRLLRDMRERPQFADPVASLYYMLSEAEPAYRKQLKGESA